MAKRVTSDFRFDFEWLGREAAVDADDATYASLVVEAGGQLATEVEDVIAKTVRSAVRVSAYRLACWLTANWWRLRWEPKSESLAWRFSHNVGSVGGGYAWPDLSFSSDGEIVLVEARGSTHNEAEPVRYLNTFAVGVTADACERQNVEHARWRKLEALLGADPDGVPHGVIAELDEMGKRIGERAMQEVASASQSEALADLRALWNEFKPGATEVAALVPDALRTWSDAVDRDAVTSWQRGESLARTARQVWGLAPGPIRNDRLSDLLEVTQAFISGAEGFIPAPFSAGFRNGDNGKFAVVINARHPNRRRFALARALAERLHSPPDDRLLPLTAAKTARQKFQRAFAQEFLCPLADIIDFLGEDVPGDEKIEEAAAHFEVSPLLVTTKLVNKGMLDRSVLDEHA